MPKLDPILPGMRAGKSGRKGAARLRELAGVQPVPLIRTRSWLERIILSLCRTYSLPIPAVNVPLLDYGVDFFWPLAHFASVCRAERSRSKITEGMTAHAERTGPDSSPYAGLDRPGGA